MMVNSRTGSRLDLEQPAPQRRLDAELRRYRGQPHGAWRLCRSLVEFGWADNADWEIGSHHGLEWLLVNCPACRQAVQVVPVSRTSTASRSPHPMLGKADESSCGLIQC